MTIRRPWGVSRRSSRRSASAPGMLVFCSGAGRRCGSGRRRSRSRWRGRSCRGPSGRCAEGVGVRGGSWGVWGAEKNGERPHGGAPTCFAVARCSLPGLTEYHNGHWELRDAAVLRVAGPWPREPRRTLSTRAMESSALGLEAEREGFEPSVRFHAHTISSRAPSTTRSPLQVRLNWGSSSGVGCAPDVSKGEGGIRTPVTLTGELDFESSAFSRSATSPWTLLVFLSCLLALPEPLEEGGQRGPALVFEDALDDLGAVGEARIFKQGVKGPDRAGLRVSAPEDYPLDAGLKDGASAHGAGLQRDVERAPWQTP